MSSPYSPGSKKNTIVTPGSNARNPEFAKSNISRILPRQNSTGALRGTQNVGYSGGVKIDGSNNRIVLGSNIGNISGTVGTIILDGDTSTIQVSDNIDINGVTEQITVSSDGDPILTMGKYTDGTFNFRVQDENGIGLAQFGQFPGGSIALKVAQSGIEVSTATAAQLVFSSSASFTVALGDTYTFPAQLVNSGVPEYATTQIIPHGAAFTPAVGCFAPQVVGGLSISPPFPPDFPADTVTFIPPGGLIYQEGLAYMQLYYGVDATNLYLGMVYINDTGAPVTLLGAPITYYVYTYVAN